jgi:hypothetical protein
MTSQHVHRRKMLIEDSIGLAMDANLEVFA